MKFLLLLLSLVFVDNGCSDSKKAQEDIISIEYSAISKGQYKMIIINNKTISVASKVRTEPTIKTCSETEWKKLSKAFQTVEVETISKLKAPSQNRLFDGAAIAKLKITYNGKVYKSQSFDHGNPPKEIKALVDEILLVSENVEKQ